MPSDGMTEGMTDGDRDGGVSGGPPFDGVDVGTVLGPLPVAVSGPAADRYWAGAGIDHPARGVGWLYPPMAANLTILLAQTRIAEPLLHARQWLAFVSNAPAPADLVVRGEVADRWRRRDREYLAVEAVVTTGDGVEMWHARGEFTQVRARRPAGPVAPGGAGRGGRRGAAPAVQPPPTGALTRALLLTPELLRTYSRAGNWHTDASLAEEAGVGEGLLAQGMQAAGPAVGVLLDRLGDGWLRRGTLDLRFVGPVYAGEEVEARVVVDGDAAELEVVNLTRGGPAVVGTARRS